MLLSAVSKRKKAWSSKPELIFKFFLKADNENSLSAFLFSGQLFTRKLATTCLEVGPLKLN